MAADFNDAFASSDEDLKPVQKATPLKQPQSTKSKKNKNNKKSDLKSESKFQTPVKDEVMSTRMSMHSDSSMT